MLDVDQQHEVDLKDQYENLYPFYKRLCSEVVFIIKEEMKKTGIKNHGLSYRIKTFDSLYKKIIRKNISSSIFSNVQDIVGVRIICLYRSDLEKIGDLISRSFETVSMD